MPNSTGGRCLYGITARINKKPAVGNRQTGIGGSTWQCEVGRGMRGVAVTDAPMNI